MPDDLDRRAERFTPLGAPVFHILLALGGEARHGYGILEAIERKTAGRAVILPGTLYVTINRMLDDGLVEQADRPEGADARRRYYRITALGRAVLAAEARRLEVLLDVARSELASGGSGAPDRG